MNIILENIRNINIFLLFFWIYLQELSQFLNFVFHNK